MMINYFAVLTCVVLSIGIAVVWYGPLFGKKWAEIVGGNFDTLEARREMQKRVMPLYITQFLLTLFQVTILAFYIEGWKEASGLENALWIWAAFVMPTIASSSMWNNDSAKISWARFLIQSGYQLIVFALFGFVLGAWK